MALKATVNVGIKNTYSTAFNSVYGLLTTIWALL